MTTNLSKTEISDYILQRGTGQPIPRKSAIVYDFMPVLLGEMFRTDEILSKMLLRSAPVEAPFILQTEAYEKLGLNYLNKENLVPALECYRISLDSRMTFKKIICAIQDNALLNPKEQTYLEISNNFEKKLVMKVLKLNHNVDKIAYNSWVEELRVAKINAAKQSRNVPGSPQHIEACLKIGEYEEAFSMAKDLGLPKLIDKVKRATHKEILDIQFLEKYISDNFPESTF